MQGDWGQSRHHGGDARGGRQCVSHSCSTDVSRTQWDLSTTDKSVAMEALLCPLVSTYPAPDMDAVCPHLIDLPHMSCVYKMLLQGGHFSHSACTIIPAMCFLVPTFAVAFVCIVGHKCTLQIACGAGTFVMAELLECLCKKGAEEVRNEVRMV